MAVSINTERLVSDFMTLAGIDSPSGHEGRVADWLEQRLKELGCETWRDNAAAEVKGETGNLLARLPGTAKLKPIALCAHMDTVEVCRGAKPVRDGDKIRSAVNTGLGSDDKTGVIAILETLRAMKADATPRGDIEVIYTVCEESGLQGARNIDLGRIKSAYCLVLDSDAPDGLIVRAPTSKHYKYTIKGRAAHAGMRPEFGISAIELAAKAIAGMKLGRLDSETTANVGIINGGVATNVVCETVVFESEARSHDPQKLDRVLNDMHDAVRRAVEGVQVEDEGQLHKASWTHELGSEYPVLKLSEDHELFKLARKAGEQLGLNVHGITSGGGSDANYFAARGLPAGVIGSGMHHVHSQEEYCEIKEFITGAQLCLEIVRAHFASQK